jgi:hypothetical protein
MINGSYLLTEKRYIDLDGNEKVRINYFRNIKKEGL